MNSEAQKITDLTLAVENDMACEVLNGLLQSPKQIAP